MRHAAIALLCFAMACPGIAFATGEAQPAQQLQKNAAEAAGWLASHRALSTRSQTQIVAKSIWTVEGDGTATHLESSLRCDGQVGDFRKTSVFVFDSFGFDIDCNYVDTRSNLITMYLTKRDRLDVDAEFADAKRQLLKLEPDATPLLAEAQATFPSDLPMQHLIYAEHGDVIHSGIWIADLGGWMFEFRATYFAGDEKAVLDEMAVLTANAEKSAGVHLGQCAKALTPERKGTLAEFGAGQDIKSIVLMTGLMQAGSSALTDKDPVKNPPPDTQWCAETAIRAAEVPVVLWHGIHPDGGDAQTDRITGVTLEPPPIVETSFDVVVTESLKKGPTWVAILRDRQKGWIYTYYIDRPGLDQLAPLYRDVVARKLKPLLGYGYENKKITFDVPPEEKQ